MKDMNSKNKEISNKTVKDVHILYHGSSIKLQRPLFGLGKSDNDYGSGFYTTEDYTKAEA